ncbi:Ribbon-helix-helix domain-containing protein [Candidatus Bealeia paramacronuclearis]|uniref:Ribbon-helix-helix domain-containing protein n=1 Tax=Candidatus Bealeia paramacronuclearis TaxID=1921001 RepID=A0ABZ2C5E1_9PROT|nr:Ribbon-helix-helix domain-containing protein [Candidatus Bealeia paramacronuclearis]
MWHEEVNSARLKKRSLTLAGHKTSISLEEPFWMLLKAQAFSQGKTLSSLILEIDSSRKGSLSSALRLYILEKTQG